MKFKILILLVCFQLICNVTNASIISDAIDSGYKSNSVSMYEGSSDSFIRMSFSKPNGNYFVELYRLSDGSLILQDEFTIENSSESKIASYIEKHGLVRLKNLKRHYKKSVGKFVVFQDRNILFNGKGHCELFDKAYLQVMKENGERFVRQILTFDDAFDYELPSSCFETGSAKKFEINEVRLSIRSFWDVGDGYLYGATSEYPMLLKFKITDDNLELIFPQNASEHFLRLEIKGIQNGNKHKIRE